MIPKGLGLKRSNWALKNPAKPEARITLFCADCPGWSVRTTMGRRAHFWEKHLAGRRHTYNTRRSAQPSRFRARKWRMG